TTLGSSGDINPMLGLAITLRQRGHRTTIATSPYYRQLIESEGIHFHAVRPDIDPSDRTMVARAMDPLRGSEYLLRSLVLPAIRESFDDLSAAADGADLIVTHPITFAGPIVAQLRSIPWVSTVLAPLSFMSIH